MAYSRNPYIYNDGESINFGDKKICNEYINVLIYTLHQSNRKKELQERYNEGKRLYFEGIKELDDYLKDLGDD